MDRFLVRLADLQVKRPLIPLFICAILTAVMGFFASKLVLKTQFDQMLPQSEPSVVELHRLLSRVPGSSNAFVVLEGEDTEQLRRFGDALVLQLRGIGLPWVSDVQDGIQPVRRFLMPRLGLFAELPQLKQLNADVDASWKRAVMHGTGLDLGLDDQPPPSFEGLRARFMQTLVRPQESENRYPDGYFQSANGKALTVVVRSALIAGDLQRGREAANRIQTLTRSVQKDFPQVHVGYAGDLVTSLEEYGAVKADLVSVGLRGVAMVLAIIFLFFMRVRALFALGFTILVGLSWTFGFTQLTIGHLNVATGFLISIVAGNGINAGIIYLGRYLEERRGGQTLAQAIDIAHRKTWLPTLSAALAAAAAYASLGITGFLGFKHFAVIGSAGMLLCWAATYLLAPTLLVIYEKFRPFHPSASRWGGWHAQYSAPFVYLLKNWPRAVFVLSIGVAVASLGLTVSYLKRDPMEYDLRRTQSSPLKNSDQHRISDLATEILGANIDGAMVILVDRLDQILPLKKELEIRRDAAPLRYKPFETIHTVLDFVPSEQTEKLSLLKTISAKLLKAHRRGAVPAKDWEGLASLLPGPEVKTYGLEDLPPEVTQPFSEKDGTRGKLVFIEPTAGESDSDLHYLLRWTDSFRQTRLPSGEIIHGSGRAMIFADMLNGVVRDIPPAVSLSLGMTLLAIGLTFRRGRLSLAVAASLVLGALGLVALMRLLDIHLNFINFVALPITFGIGVDYAVNIAQRYSTGDGPLKAVRHTGEAVMLCSLTTSLSYLALLGSINQAVRSLGTLAVIGEICCLVSAVLFLPAWLLRWDAGHPGAVKL